MINDINTAIISGFLTLDPIRPTNDKMPIKFTIKSENAYIRNGKTQHSDRYIQCVSFALKDEKRFLRKGVHVMCTGYLQTSSYMGNDGKKIYNMQYVVDRIQFLKTNAEEEMHRDIEQGWQQNRDDYGPYQINDDDDIAF